MSSESIHGDDDAPKRNQGGLSRRDKRRERTNQWRLKKSLDKLNLTPSPGIEESDKPQRKPKGLTNSDYEMERKKRRKLNRSLSKLSVGHGLDVKEPEPINDQQNIRQTVHEKRKPTQFTSSVGAVNDRSNSSIDNIGAFPNSEAVTSFCKDSAPSGFLPAKTASLSVYMDDAHDQYPIIQSGTMIRVTDEPLVATDLNRDSTVTHQVNIHGV